MAAPTTRTATSAGNGSGTSVSVTKPTGTASGDLVNLYLYLETTAAVTWPSGFTENTTLAAPTGNQFRLRHAYKTAGSSEPASYAPSWTGAAWRDIVCVAVVPPAGTTLAIDNSASAINSSSTANRTQWPTITGFSTGHADCLLLFAQAWFGGASNFAPPTGWTELSDTADDLEVASTTQATAGASGNINPQDPTSSGSGPWGTMVVAIYGAAGGGGSNFTASLTGSVTMGGAALARATTKPRTGGVTLGGAAVTKAIGKPRTGSITTSGALTRSAGKPLTGAVTLAGALTRQAGKALAGAVTAGGGNVTRACGKALAGAASLAGSIARAVAKGNFTGSVTPSGALSTLKVFLKNLSGTVTLTGSTVRRAVAKPLAGAVTLGGSLAKSVGKALVGALTLAGSLTRQTAAGVASWFYHLLLSRPHR